MLKRKIDHVTPDTKQELLNAIKDFNIISFDIFDTLLFRTIANPSHSFFLMQKEAEDILDHEYGIDFHKTRLQAEGSARKKAGDEFGHQDIEFSNIYDEFKELAGASDEQIDKLKQMELEAELRLCKPNNFIKDIVEEVLTMGKKIIYVSDMYLDTDFIKQLLENNGYIVKDNLFVSSEAKKTKHMGDLYPHVMEKINCKASDILHIGDNIYSDVKQSAKYNIKSFHIPKPTDSFFSNKRNLSLWHTPDDARNINRSVILGLIANKSYAHKSAKQENSAPYSMDWEMFGYYVAGPLFLSFMQWVIEESKNDNIDKIYFLARDGYILQKIYEILKPVYKNLPDSVYTYSSRRAWKMARIRKLDNDAKIFLRGDCNEVTIDHLIKRVGLNPDDFTNEIKNADIDRKELLKIGADADRIDSFFTSIEDVILKEAEQERNDTLAYFESIDLGSKQNAAIVDVGWHGSMQSNLAKILKDAGLNDGITGYYFGTRIKALDLRERGYKTKSFLFHQGEPFHYEHTVFSCLEIFELLFTAPDPSLIKMKRNGNNIEPVFDDIDSNEARHNLITKMQKGALEFTKDYADIYQYFPHLQHSVHYGINTIQEIVLRPDDSETRMFDDILHGMDYGQARLIVEEPSISKLLLHPIKFGIQYRDTFWKAAFEKRLPWVWRKYLHFMLKIYFKLQSVKWKINNFRYRLRLRTRLKDLLKRK